MRQQGVQHRNVVAQRLARGGGRHDHNISSGQRFLHRVGLVSVELLDASFLEHFDKKWIEAFRKARVRGILRRKVLDVRNALLQSARQLQFFDNARD